MVFRWFYVANWDDPYVKFSDEFEFCNNKRQIWLDSIHLVVFWSKQKFIFGSKSWPTINHGLLLVGHARNGSFFIHWEKVGFSSHFGLFRWTFYVELKCVRYSFHVIFVFIMLYALPWCHLMHSKSPPGQLRSILGRMGPRSEYTQSDIVFNFAGWHFVIQSGN